MLKAVLGTAVVLEAVAFDVQQFEAAVVLKVVLGTAVVLEAVTLDEQQFEAEVVVAVVGAGRQVSLLGLIKAMFQPWITS